MTDPETEVKHERTICPDCGFANVTVQVAPGKPARMYCTNCHWDSINGGNDD